MSVLATSVAVLTVDLVLPRLGQGALWRLKEAKPAASDKAGFRGVVVAVVPARNEAALIGPVVASLLSQSVAMPALLVHDESTAMYFQDSIEKGADPSARAPRAEGNESFIACRRLQCCSFSFPSRRLQSS